MKKYRLIKEYPGSDHEGIIISLKTPNGLYEGYQYNYSTKHVENSPEYWEEVVKKDYEIISYWSPRIGDSKYLYYEGHEDWDNINKSQCHSIHSVKRLSDGEILTIGDKARTVDTNGRHTIRQFGIKQKCFGKNFSGNYTYDGIDRIWIDWEENCGGNWLESTEKIKQPIFLTHDGKDIFEGDRIVWVIKDSLVHGTFTADYGSLFLSDQYKYFISAVDAQDYIERNKPRLSIEDCFKILQKSFLYGDGFEKEIEKYVTKNNK